MKPPLSLVDALPSRPARAAWIETFFVDCMKKQFDVAARAGRVD